MVQRLIAAAALAFPVLLAASPKDSLELFYRTQKFNDVALAPDGRQVAWSEERPKADHTPSTDASIYICDTAGGTARRLSGDGAPLCDEHGLSWSPDGRRLAFLSDRKLRQQLQLYVAQATGGVPRMLTNLSGYVARPRWSPDGRTIALLNMAVSQAAAGAVEAAAHETGEVAVHVVEERLVLIDAATGAVRTLSPPESHVYEYDWSPDGRQIAVISAPGSGDNNWWIARLSAIDTATGAVRELYAPQAQIAVPRWSPDGRQIAFIQGLMSDAGSTGGEIWVVPAGGGPARNLTPGRKSSPSWLNWRPGPGRLLFSEFDDGGCAVGQLDTASGQAITLWKGDERIDAGSDSEDLSLSVAADGATAAVVRSSFDHPPEVWLGPIGRWQPLTHANAKLRPLWGRAESIHWTSDGLHVQGWLIYPRDFDPGKRYPLVVNVHGGPASQATPSWGGTPLSLAAEGYFIFEPNPRGSYGQGEAFTAANVRDFGYGDLRDILGGLDRVLGTRPVDARRLGACGWSYGGYMTMWMVTQTGRFRAAVAGAGVCDWLSYYGQNMIDQWMIPYFGKSVYDDPPVYARSSPISFVKRVSTPTLILVGDSDKECPAPQSYEYWHALRALGVETKLVVYENEGHRFRNPAHVEDRLTRTVSWFDQHLR
ncbi:MAG TPA: S9 family peptidase [Opitutaceae bacterium]|nr:S9 family peptidase [Opitutaceae bacterium]